MRQALSVSSLGDVLRALTDLRPDTDIIFLSLSLGKGRHYDIANYIVLRQPSCILFWLIWQMLPKLMRAIGGISLSINMSKYFHLGSDTREHHAQECV